MNDEEINEYFKTQSEKYLPEKIKHLLIAESPPNDIRNYFYYDGPKPKYQMFFQNIIMAIYNEHCATDPVCRKIFLNRFKDDRFFLIDAVEDTITNCTNSERKVIILEDLPKLIEILIGYKNRNSMDNNTKIILIKKLVCELLKDPLEDNEDIVFDRSVGIGEVGFPMFFKDPGFAESFRDYFQLS